MTLTNPGTPFDEDGWADALSDIRKLQLAQEGGSNDLNQASQDVAQDTPVSGFLEIVNNLSDLEDAAVARDNLGLGTVATQNANAVALTGGTIVGVSLSGVSAFGGTFSGATLSAPIISGGTLSGSTFGAGTISGSAMGGGTISGTTISGATIGGGTISGTTITTAGGALSGTTFNAPVISGGTMVGSTLSGVTVVSGTISSLAVDLALVDGGTGASTKIDALANLGAFPLAPFTTHTKRVIVTGGVYSFTGTPKFLAFLAVGAGGGGADNVVNGAKNASGGGGASGGAVYAVVPYIAAISSGITATIGTGVVHAAGGDTTLSYGSFVAVCPGGGGGTVGQNAGAGAEAGGVGGTAATADAYSFFGGTSGTIPGGTFVPLAGNDGSDGQFYASSAPREGRGGSGWNINGTIYGAGGRGGGYTAVSGVVGGNGAILMIELT